MTGASRGYAFVEFETEREMRRAYKVHHLTNLMYLFPNRMGNSTLTLAFMFGESVYNHALVPSLTMFI